MNDRLATRMVRATQGVACTTLLLPTLQRGSMAHLLKPNTQ